MKKKVMLVFDRRPEAIKIRPPANELKSRLDDFEVVVCFTGQYWEMHGRGVEARGRQRTALYGFTYKCMRS